jgi:hypothetical protein
MNSLVNKSQMFLKRNGSTILTCVGAVGVVATTVAAVKATPKAMRLLEQAKVDKGDDLTRFETVKIAAPAYIPTALIGVSTLACIFGANVLSRRGQASLMSAYALVDSSYKDYKKKVDEIYGEEAGAQVREGIAKDKYDEDDQFPLEEGQRLYYDFYSGVYFQATPYEVKRAEYEINRTLMMDDCVYLNEWYTHLGLEPLDHGYDFGWSTCANMDAYWQTWIDFNHEHVVMDDGLECIIISFMQDPFPDFEDWC